MSFTQRSLVLRNNNIQKWLPAMPHAPKNYMKTKINTTCSFLPSFFPPAKSKFHNCELLVNALCPLPGTVLFYASCLPGTVLFYVCGLDILLTEPSFALSRESHLSNTFYNQPGYIAWWLRVQVLKLDFGSYPGFLTFTWSTTTLNLSFLTFKMRVTTVLT